MKRAIVEIDRGLCNGCGRCASACAEGALALDAEGKAVLVRDVYCDGLGACLAVCPTGALKVLEKESAAYDEEAAAARASAIRDPAYATPPARPGEAMPSELGQWPIQLHLVSPGAPYFRECDLLVAADCTAFALGAFHAELLRGKALVIACPKLDRTEGYVEKLTELIADNTVYSITVAVMEVPCCSGLSRIVAEAVGKSGKNIAVKTVVVGIDGLRR
jgi:NAD-dependent dihydropyrimidine dehydrogenase PreA subunit